MIGEKGEHAMDGRLFTLRPAEINIETEVTCR